MRDERVCQKRPAQKTNAVLFENRRSTRQKRPINVKRDLSTSKETHQRQKRPIKVKRDLSRSKETYQKRPAGPKSVPFDMSRKEKYGKDLQKNTPYFKRDTVLTCGEFLF